MVVDAALAVALAVLAFMPTASVAGPEIGDLPEVGPDALGVALALGQCLPLVARRTRPALCLLLVGGAFGLHQALGYPTTFGGVGLYLALIAAGAWAERRRALLAGVAVAGYAVLAVVLAASGSPQRARDFAAYLAVLVVCWLAGAWLRRRRAEEAERRELTARVVAVEERARIARELHDVVTHHVTAVVVQADAAGVLLPTAPERVGEALEVVAGTGRRALADLRDLLGGWRRPVVVRTGFGSWWSGPGGVGSWSSWSRAVGWTGCPPRWGSWCTGVVQESLTNAVKHAPGLPTRVVVRRVGGVVEVVVTTSGAVVAEASPDGRGLAGLRRRAEELGGEVVGAAADGEEALALAAQLRPDVVVMDVRMPKLDGIAATRALAGPEAAAPVKVLVVTTFNVDHHVYEALRAGASGFLLKDSPPARLLEGVRTVARGEALLDPSVTRELIGRYATRVRPREEPVRGALAGLSPRELEVLRLVADGRSNSEIAVELVLSPETVKTYVSRLLAKLDLRDRVQAVVPAHRTGLVGGA
ncbi:response regulator [Actinosynnema pretiosum subsp. pretiosum]|uniref:Response regulator n=1 Tax=Actinosynnema pretiosum subsp. pretiosum TaxID=103721 RepID=A0AA45R5F7_9PSEU|nr:DNA-binding response regulator, LuxR family [Actinosynnema pretiosum subsp. pretiosum]QUF05640.1 response regulator [Actinosynnema pretiosum subsp. pretiosum]